MSDASKLYATATAVVVEDDAISLILLQNALERLGYSVVSAGSVAEAKRTFSAVHNQKPNISNIELLVCDYQLSDGYGTELLNSLRNGSLSPSLKHISAIIVSAGNRHVEAAASLAAVALQKPITGDKLSAAIDEAAGVTRATEALVALPPETYQRLPKLCQIYIDQVREDLAQIASVSSDDKTKAVAAHRIAGAAGNLGFNELREAALVAESQLAPGANTPRTSAANDTFMQQAAAGDIETREKMVIQRLIYRAEASITACEAHLMAVFRG